MSDSIAIAERGVALRLEGVRRVFDNQLVVIDDFNLSIDAGEFLAVLGPSGCGKSTLLRMIARLSPPDAGRIVTDPDAFQVQYQTAFVFQDAHLLPWRSVLDNAALPLELMGAGREERYARTRAVLDQVGLADAEARYPSQLSGGMRMRVSLARALVTEPRLLLMDEPFAALDEITRRELAADIHRLWAEHRPAIVFVTHNVEEAVYMAGRVVVMSAGPGRIAGEVIVDGPVVRPPGFRTTATFRETAEAVSRLLAGKVAA